MQLVQTIAFEARACILPYAPPQADAMPSNTMQGKTRKKKARGRPRDEVTRARAAYLKLRIEASPYSIAGLCRAAGMIGMHDYAAARKALTSQRSGISKPMIEKLEAALDRLEAGASNG